jgi:SAM-dependent methyltransferase
VTATSRVDFFDKPYANFAEQVLVAIREQTFGHDIGQNSWVTAEEYEVFIRFLGLGRGTHALEIASGSGGPAVHLARRTGCRLTGIDANPNGVAVSMQAATRAGLSEPGLAERVNFQVHDATRPLPFDAGTFDALLCIDSMNHFPDRGNSLSEWYRVLKPGGRAVFTDPVLITGPVTNDELAQRSSIGLFVFVPRGHNEELIVKAGFKLASQLDLTENASLVSRRWREARARFRDELVRMEGEAQFEGVQKFLGAVHRLTAEKRLSRVAYFVEKN